MSSKPGYLRDPAMSGTLPSASLVAAATATAANNSSSSMAESSSNAGVSNGHGHGHGPSSSPNYYSYSSVVAYVGERTGMSVAQAEQAVAWSAITGSGLLATKVALYAYRSLRGDGKIEDEISDCTESVLPKDDDDDDDHDLVPKDVVTKKKTATNDELFHSRSHPSNHAPNTARGVRVYCSCPLGRNRRNRGQRGASRGVSCLLPGFLPLRIDPVYRVGTPRPDGTGRARKDPVSAHAGAGRTLSGLRRLRVPQNLLRLLPRDRQQGCPRLLRAVRRTRPVRALQDHPVPEHQRPVLPRGRHGQDEADVQEGRNLGWNPGGRSVRQRQQRQRQRQLFRSLVDHFGSHAALSFPEEPFVFFLFFFLQFCQLPAAVEAGEPTAAETVGPGVVHCPRRRSHRGLLSEPAGTEGSEATAASDDTHHVVAHDDRRSRVVGLCAQGTTTTTPTTTERRGRDGPDDSHDSPPSRSGRPVLSGRYFYRGQCLAHGGRQPQQCLAQVGDDFHSTRRQEQSEFDSASPNGDLSGNTKQDEVLYEQIQEAIRRLDQILLLRYYYYYYYY
mmetsp:Transcript_6658/g.19179  ORF Transcript_6658/g.19179 Transcript_6658/m.19179 type:complete len:559 (+) Transcript_6658:351-2027(+)